MDKTKKNFVIIISVLVIMSLVLIAYVASLNAQLNAEKIKTMQLNDQIAGLNAKANNSQAQLANAITNANDQTNLVNSLRSSLDTTNAELDKLKTEYADLESKLKAQVSVSMPQPAVN